MEINQQEFNRHKEIWSNIAKKNNWHYEPFHIQAMVNQHGKIIDSVSVREMKKDFIVNAETGEEITDFKFVTE